MPWRETICPSGSWSPADGPDAAGGRQDGNRKRAQLQRGGLVLPFQPQRPKDRRKPTAALEQEARRQDKGTPRAKRGKIHPQSLWEPG